MRVIPAKAGIQVGRRWRTAWTPAFAGVTKWDGDRIGVQSPEEEKGDRASGGSATAATRIVNAIATVCKAASGLFDALSVPLPIGRGLRW
jgi:hypothetical protein